MQSALLIPLVVAVVVLLAFFTIRSLLNLRQNKELVSRLGDFVTLPAEERAAERRKEVDQLLAAVGSLGSSASATSDGWRASPRTSTWRRSGASRRT